MASYHPSDMEADSVTSSPRSDHFHEPQPRVRFMCSFGGNILPRPHDNQLRYVGGDTRIVAVHRSISFSALHHKLSKLSGFSTTNITAKYQLPNEDLDALISVSTDEDVENMMDEYDRVAHNQNPRTTRLRLFLFPEADAAAEAEAQGSRTSSISSLLNGSANRENWFLDALNGRVSNALERGRSEASSLVSEVPDYLFGLDNSDETQNHSREPRPKDRPLLHDNVSHSDPGSPTPVVSSPFCSTSSAPSIPIPDLPPVKTKPTNPVPPHENQTGNNPAPHYAPGPDASYSVQPLPVYYIPSPVQPGSGPLPVQQVPVQAHYPYLPQPYHALVPPQLPIGYHHLVPRSGSGQAYGAGFRHVAPLPPYNPSAAPVQEGVGVKQQFYQAVPNSVAYPMTVTGGEEPQRGGAEFVTGRGTNSQNE